MSRTSFEVIKLKNGLPVLLLPAGRQSRTASLFFIARSGSERESKKIKGAAHFLEHMCFKGSKNYPGPLDISVALDSLGAEYNAYTSRQNTVYYASSSPSALPKIVSILADMYGRPNLTSADLERERGVILEELRMYKDFPPDLAEELIWPLTYGQSISAGWSVVGEEETIQNMKIRDLRNFYHKNYSIANSAVIIAGRFDSSKILAILEKETTDFAKGKKLPSLSSLKRRPGLRLETINKKTDQNHFMSSFPGFSYSASQLPQAVILSAILGGGMSSRLFIKLREELGVAYYCFARHYALANRGLFMIGAGLRKDSFLNSLEAVFEEVTKIKERPISSQELFKVKNSLKGRILLSLETPAGLASFFTSRLSAGLPLVSPEDYLNALESVTAEQIRVLAEDIFSASNLSLSVVGEKLKLDKIEKLATKILG
ncbi:MAG TPA: insulinase family protein [Candidatus Vogelbacteria bacterium]|mgnify:CR=1 FL=1|nr:insulinase family protein [Candidatus Vogelbacteria bacterium]